MDRGADHLSPCDVTEQNRISGLPMTIEATEGPSHEPGLGQVVRRFGGAVGQEDQESGGDG